MANPIDVFVLPVPRNRLNEAKRVAEAVEETRTEHDDLQPLVKSFITLSDN